jgi:hypothetical protein
MMRHIGLEGARVTYVGVSNDVRSPPVSPPARARLPRVRLEIHGYRRGAHEDGTAGWAIACRFARVQ